MEDVADEETPEVEVAAEDDSAVDDAAIEDAAADDDAAVEALDPVVDVSAAEITDLPSGPVLESAFDVTAHGSSRRFLPPFSLKAVPLF